MAIYFVRHGESEANERNRFAGRQDTPLTTLGVRQAEQAGRRIAELGVEFDEVHVSPLGRAYRTAETIVAALPGASPRFVVSEALVERDFGHFTDQNKSLIKKSLGYRRYTEFFHSATGTPPGGEPWDRMYERVRAYYRDVLLPAANQGHDILVVSHKYVVEMFAVVISGMAPEEYHDLKVPNARPLSEADLGRLAGGGAVAKAVDRLGEEVEIRLPIFVAAAFIIGVATRSVVGIAVPHLAFCAGLALLLGVNSFYTALRVDPAALRLSRHTVAPVLPLLLLRAIAGATLLLTGRSPAVLLVGVFLLLPPALAAPSLSLLWGGDYFAAARHTLVSTIALPLVLLGTGLAGRLTLGESSRAELTVLLPALYSFAAVLVLGLLLPAGLAQIDRRRRPIQAGKTATNWGWIGPAALVPLAAFAAYALSPADSVARVYRAGITPSTLRLLGLVVVVTIVARAGAWLFTLTRRLSEGLRRDLYISQVTPNIFLWLAVADALVPSAHLPGSLSIAVIAGFFLAMIVDEAGFVARFRAGLWSAFEHGPARISREVPDPRAALSLE